MITEISLQNLKGTTTTQKLSGLDLLIGTNGSGKSSRLEAIQIALLGYTPNAGGQRSEDTFKLASAEEMSTGLKTNDGFSFIRKFSIKNKIVNSELTITPSKGEKNLTQKKSRIEYELGNLPIMLDFEQFLSKTDSKKRDFIYNLLSLSNQSVWDKTKFYYWLSQRLLSGEIKQNEKLYLLMKQCLDEAIAQYPNGYTPQEALTAIIAWVMDKGNYWKSIFDKSKATVQSLSEYKSNSSETDEKSIGENKEELKKLRTELIKIEKQIATTTTNNLFIKEKENKIVSLKKIIEEFSASIISLKSIEDEITRLKSNLKDSGDLDLQMDEISKNLEYLESKQSESEKKINKIKIKGASKKAEYNSLKEIYSKIEAQSGICVLDKKISCNKDFAKYMEYTAKKITDLVTEMNSLMKLIDNENILIKKNAQNISSEKQKLQQIKTKKVEISKNNTEINSKLKAKESNLNSINTNKALLKEKKENLAALEKDLSQFININNKVPLDLLEKQKNSLLSQISILENKIESQDKLKANNILLNNAILDAKSAEQYLQVYRSIALLIGPKGLQGEVVKTMLDPIKKSIQENLELLGVNFKFYFQCETITGKEVFNFGWNKNGHNVSFNTLSTAEQMQILIAFVTTIVTDYNPKLKILLIDKIEHLDTFKYKSVLEGLANLKKNGKYDNIIITKVKNEGNEKITALAEKEGFSVWDIDKINQKEIVNNNDLEEAI